MNSPVRLRLYRALHSEAAKRGLDHSDLHEICRARFGVDSMRAATDAQLQQIYAEWTGRRIKRTSALPARGGGDQRLIEMVTGDDIETLARAFALRGWDAETQRNFVRRQLGGREQIRTRADFWRVFSGVRAMNRRDGIYPR